MRCRYPLGPAAPEMANPTIAERVTSLLPPTTRARNAGVADRISRRLFELFPHRLPNASTSIAAARPRCQGRNVRVLMRPRSVIALAAAPVVTAAASVVTAAVVAAARSSRRSARVSTGTYPSDNTTSAARGKSADVRTVSAPRALARAVASVTVASLGMVRWSRKTRRATVGSFGHGRRRHERAGSAVRVACAFTALNVVAQTSSPSAKRSAGWYRIASSLSFR